MKKPKPSPPPPASAPGAQELWLASLDIFSQATKAATEAASHVAGLAASASAPPSLEGLFEARVAKALARLGAPTRAEIRALSAQVDHLQSSLRNALQTIEALTGKSAQAGAAEKPLKKVQAVKAVKVAKEAVKPAKPGTRQRAGQS